MAPYGRQLKIHTKQMNIRVTPDLYEDLKQAASRRRVPMSHVVREALEDVVQTETAIMRRLSMEERMKKAQLDLP